jgi:hypothetical protein
MRWPASWKDPSALALVKGTAINCLLLEPGAGLAPVAERAKQAGLTVVDGAHPPAGVTIVKGEWPGIQLSRGGGDATDAGPTGVPWVDSNGWKIRLEAALHPGSGIWVDAPPKGPIILGPSYLLAIADSGAHGGRWILSLEDQLASSIAKANPKALETWKSLAGAAGFFAMHKGWADYLPQAVIGVVSDFTGQNEFFSLELLNLLARTNEQYRIMPKADIPEPSWTGLRAVIYADADPPGAALRKRILAFVEAGGMLITGPKWGPPAGAPARGDEFPRYSLRVLGKGRVAVATSDPDDPYVLANDSVVLVSHRYDLLRFWNGGAVGSYLTMAPDRKHAVAHLLFYASRGPDEASVRVAGRFRTGRLWTLDRTEPRPLPMERQADAVELHLPSVSHYAAAELEV